MVGPNEVIIKEGATIMSFLQEVFQWKGRIKNLVDKGFEVKPSLY